MQHKKYSKTRLNTHCKARFKDTDAGIALEWGWEIDIRLLIHIPLLVLVRKEWLKRKLPTIFTELETRT